jgi:hypothetical protein
VNATIRFAGMLAAVASLSCACSGSAPAALSPSASTELEDQTAAVRGALLSGNPALARAELVEMTAELTQLERQRQLSSVRAAAIRAAITAVLNQVPSPGTPSPPTTSAPVQPTSPPRGHTGPLAPGGGPHHPRGHGSGNDSQD